MDLNALQDFVFVANHGGFAPASRAKGIPKSSLSRRVRELEERLGVRLLDRTSRTFRLTDEGGELLQTAGPTLLGIEELAQAIQSKGGGEPTGRLRIAAPTLFGDFFLGRLAARYIAAYPRVDLEIVVGDRHFDLLAEGFDAAIRVNATETHELIRRRITNCRMQLVASRAFAERFGKLTPRVCRQLPTVLFDHAPVAPPWRFFDGTRRYEVTPRATLRLSTLAMVRDAVLEGAGFAMLPDTLAADGLSRGELILFGDLEGVQVDLSIVHPSRRLVSRRLRVFIDMVVAAFPGGQKPGYLRALPRAGRS